MTTALMATEVYGKGAGEYGVLGSIIAVGSLAGSLLAARRVRPAQRLVIVAAIAFGSIELVAGLMPTYLTFAVILPLCGFAALTVITAANAFVQMSVDAHMRGRVMALYMAIFMGGTPFGSPLLGWIADQFGARWTLHRRRRPDRPRDARRSGRVRTPPGRGGLDPAAADAAGLDHGPRGARRDRHRRRRLIGVVYSERATGEAA